MESSVVTVLSIFSPHPEVSLLRVARAPVAQRAVAGQFVMVKEEGAGWDPFLREPLFLTGAEREAEALTLWVPSGPTTRERLRGLSLHAKLDLLGPFGSGFVPRQEWRHLLLVAEGLAIGPLLLLMQQAMAAGQSVALLAIVPQGTEGYPADALPLSVEYQGMERLDPSNARELLLWADGVVAAGSQSFYHTLTDAIRAARPGQRGGFAFGLMLEPFGWNSGGGSSTGWGESRVACATAACRACVVELRRERALACTRGPLFDLWAL
jgi:ferredoxin-NADP reductase